MLVIVGQNDSLSLSLTVEAAGSLSGQGRVYCDGRDIHGPG